MNDIEHCVLTACLWEASARKAGNVHISAECAGLTYLEFVSSAKAIAPVMAADVEKPLGIAILNAIRATRAIVHTNTNLGIVLLLAPLVKCNPGDWRPQLETFLAATTVDDAKQVYEAIRLAEPGGLGEVDEEDVARQPTQTLREVMALAADRDLIALQYSDGFCEVLDEGVPALLDGWHRFQSVEAAILHLQVDFLSRFPDSLIARKYGIAEAEKISDWARGIDLATEEGKNRFTALDRRLRQPGHRRNPGTTADLIAACLYVALREGRLDPSATFAWNEQI